MKDQVKLIRYSIRVPLSYLQDSLPSEIDILNETKTLFSRASIVIMQNPDSHENKPDSYILLETKLARKRQNYDYFMYRSFGGKSHL